MKRKFGMADKLGYMFGDFGNDFAFILSSMFLLKFYTDVMGVSAAVVGTMMMAARLLDAFTDVTMGQIADRSRGNKKGKFAPWLLRMCGPVAVSSFLMYASWFAEMPMTFKIIWMFLRICSGAVCFIRQLIFHMVRWHRQFRQSQKTERRYRTGGQSALRLRQRLLVLYCR